MLNNAPTPTHQISQITGKSRSELLTGELSAAKSTTPVVTVPIFTYINESRMRGHREETIRLRRSVLARLRMSVGPLLEADAEAIIAWYSQFADSPAKTRATYGQTIKTFYRWAVARKLIDNDPSLMLPVPRAPRGTPRPIPVKDLTAAFQAADDRMRLWLTLGAFAGLRAGEIARLRREDVLDTARVPILNVINGKGGKDREVLIGQRVIDAVTPYRKGRLSLINRPALTMRMSEFFRGLDQPWTCHNLRHFFGTELYRASGGDIRFVQEQMGHSSPLTTAIYAKYAAEKATESIALLDKVLDTAPTSGVVA